MAGYVNYFATGLRSYQEQAIGVSLRDRFSHIWILGQTGTGKTTLLRRLILNDLAAGYGVGVLDTHDLCDQLLDDITRSRIKDVCLFDLLDQDCVVGLNPFHNELSLPKTTIVSLLIGQWKAIWESWGPRLENTLRHAALALFDLPGTTLADLRAFLLSVQYRRRVLASCRDPHVLSFWTDEFEKYRSEFQVEAIAPIMNKLDAFLASPLRASLCTRHPRLNLRKLIDTDGILLVPLNKGLLGDEAAQFAGSVILAQLLAAILSRFDTPEQQRRPWFLYLDEFIGNRLAVEAMNTILGECRKMQVGLTFVQHYLGECDPKLIATLFGNVGTVIAFRVSVEDAPVLARKFSSGGLVPNDLHQLDNFFCYAQVIEDGSPVGPFLCSTFPPAGKPARSWRARIREVSRQRFSRPRSILESSYRLLVKDLATG